MLLSRKQATLFIIALFLISLIGCGSLTGPSNKNGLSDAQRTAAFDSINNFMSNLPRVDSTTDSQKIAAFLAKMPVFEATGISTDGCAWGRFTDGRLFIAVANRPGPTSRAVHTQIPRSTRAAGTGLPADTVMHIYDTMGTVFTHAAPTFAPTLSAHGYQLYNGSIQKGTINDLQQVNGDGVFYMDAHGGTGVARWTPKLFSIWSGTKQSFAGDNAFAVDLNLSLLVYMSATTDTVPNDPTHVYVETHYAITSRFVDKYMKFGPNSLVFINACSSDTSSFKNACTRNGAGVYMGWTKPVGDGPSYDAAMFLFDRMLGYNAVAPPDSPTKPPFDWSELQAAMATTVNPNTGITFDTSGGNFPSKLIFTAGPGDLGVLVPSIHDITVDVTKSEATLTGKFGAKQGQVMANASQFIQGTALQVKTWSATQIVVGITDETITVTAKADGRPGNTVNINQVKIDPVDTKVDPGKSVTFTATITGKGSFTYDWDTSGGSGHLEDSHGHSGDKFTSTDATVTYVCDANAEPNSVDEVNVKGNLINGNTKTPLNSAGAHVKVGGGKYILSGPNGTGIGVDDNLGIWLNNVLVFYDPRGSYSGYRGPFTLDAKPGDILRIQVQDWYGIHAGISPVYLTKPDGTSILIQPAIDMTTPQGSQAIVLDQTYTIP
ncbi:MAG: hypothetical protein ABJA67_04415 [Chthonomonadales bacterium]